MADAETIAKDLPEYISSLKGLSTTVENLSEHVDRKIKKIDDEEISTSKGISFLEIKFHLLLSYLINVVYYILIKTEGQNIEGDPVVDRLVEIRTVLEKLRPIDQKMKYQIDKLVKLVTAGLAGTDNDPLRFRPNPENMLGKLDESEDDSETSDTAKASGIYVPPKVSAVPYDEGYGSRKERKLEEHTKKRVLNSRLLQELREEFSEAPVEIREDTLNNRAMLKKRDDDEHQERYEEENFIRLAAKKRKKGDSARMKSDLDDLTSFSDLSALTGDKDERPSRFNSSKGKKPKWKRKSKAGSGKRRFGRKR